MSADDLYYYRKPGEKTMGPEKLSVLIEYSNQGDLPMETQACKHGTSVWQFFSSVVKSAGDADMVSVPEAKYMPPVEENKPSDPASLVVDILGIIGGIMLALSAVIGAVALYFLLEGKPSTSFFSISLGAVVSGVLFFALQEALIRLGQIADSLKK